jgi:sugar phosphate isomerase/epimerase
MNRPAAPLPRNCVAMSLRGSETTEAISQGIRNKEIATPAYRNASSPDALDGALRRAGTLSPLARNDKKGITTRSPKKGEEGGIQEKDVEAWRHRVSRSLREILNNGIEPKRISIETLGYPFEWIEDTVKEFGFSICLDIGHILTHGYDLDHYFKTYLPETSIIHLHGVNNGSDHLGIERLPEPDLDLILSALRHYHGLVSIEVFSIDKLGSSLSILEEKWMKS